MHNSENLPEDATWEVSHALGEGAFGQVELVQDPEGNQNLYARK